jgi:methylated-DNA-[protein]-cysteine S-methyltransferase
MMRRRLTLETPTGPVTVTEEDGAIVAVTWGAAGRGDPDGGGDSDLLRNAAQQLHDYFAGSRRTFDLPLLPRGSAFHRAVWREMLAIPYGCTKSYGDLAKATGAIARAVGTACGANPIPIFIPCHRVLAADRQLGGFSGGRGPETKAFLLTLEGAWPVQHALPLG